MKKTVVYSDYINKSPEELLDECQIYITRGSGPGGQNRNKRNTAVTLVHTPTGITIYCCDQRTQGQNKSIAVKRLHEHIQLEMEKEIRKKKHQNWRNKKKINRHSHSKKMIKKQQMRKKIKHLRRKIDY